MTAIETELTNFILNSGEHYPAVEKAVKELLAPLTITYDFIDEKYMKIEFTGEGVNDFWTTGYVRIDFAFYGMDNVIARFGKDEYIEEAKKVVGAGIPLVEMFIFYFNKVIEAIMNEVEKFENLWVG
jgi:hypothetical protein